MKPFVTITIATEEQNIEITPTTQQDGIIIQAKEVDNTLSNKIYLNSKEEVAVFIKNLQEMINHINLK